MPIHEFGKGAIKRPYKIEILSATPTSVVPDFTKSTGLQEPPDEDQGSSGSCTSQANGYYLWQWVGEQISRNDTYSHTFLPGGGAYLDAPGNFVLNTGFLNRVPNHPDPKPQTEQNMETVILAVTAAGRTRTYSFQVKNIACNINTIGSVLEQYKGCIIGVDGNNSGWLNLDDPTYNGHADWGHALYVYDRAVRNGKNALKAKSSWCNEVKDHFINSDYFANGGVFEALVYDNFKEIMTNVQFVHKAGTPEYGFYVPATSAETIKDKALNFDAQIFDASGNVDFTKAVDITGLK